MAHSRYRSVTYHLDASIELARAVDQAGGHTDMATVAAALSYSGTRNGAFLTRLANARLFGLVSGRSGQVILSERGRRCLSPDAGVARDAGAEACLGVPLFRAVLDHFATTALPGPLELAKVLEEQFGESSTRAMTTARALGDSARQAGLLTGKDTVISQVSRVVTNFTDLPSAPRSSFAPQVRWTSTPRFTRARGSRQRGSRQGGPDMVDQRSVTPGADGSEGSGLWIDEGGSGRPTGGRSRRAWVTVGAAACLLVVGVPVGLLVSAGSGPTLPHQTAQHTKVAVRLGGAAAKRSVLAALSATTDSGSFAFTYQLTQSPGTSTTTTTMPVCGVETVGPCGEPNLSITSVQGSGIINANPMAMAASANIGQGGPSGLQVGVRVNPTTVWEVGNTDNGLTPQSENSNDTGQSLPDFAGITEGTLGQQEGAVAMMGMASPTGYLDLVQPAVSSATEVGASTVDGVSVTQYKLAIDPSSLATAPGVTTEEADTITSALSLLTTAGLTGIQDFVSIDASGFIRESSSTVSFADGGTVTLDAHFSNFGCAGTVLMPNQGGVSNPPPNCSTADTGVAPSTTTTTAPTGSSTTTTTVPTGSSTTTTTELPGATTTTTTSPNG
jgi:hypothetical protein